MADPIITAYEIHRGSAPPPEPAPIARDWMDSAHLRHPYRCLPLSIANQSGWILRSPVGFRAYWYGGSGKKDVMLNFDGDVDPRIVSHFGSGVVTFTIPFIFRTPPEINLWVKGPSNMIKDGVQPLEGVVETDWLASTFTMNWKITRVCEWIRFDEGEPICMLVPIPRGLAEALLPQVQALDDHPELKAEYLNWESARKGFINKLEARDADAVKQGWQKEYFRGKTGAGSEFPGHQTRLNLRPFVSGGEEPQEEKTE